MDIQITVTVNSPDILEAAKLLADAFTNIRFKAALAASMTPANSEGIKSAARDVLAENEPTGQAPDVPSEQPAAPDPAPTEGSADPAQALTLEQVRAALTKLPTDKARAIITSFGAPKLTAVSPQHYPALMAKIKEAS